MLGPMMCKFIRAAHCLVLTLSMSQATVCSLGIVVNNKMTVADHINYLLSSYSSRSYALRVFNNHGVLTASLHDVFPRDNCSKAHVLCASVVWKLFGS